MGGQGHERIRSLATLALLAALSGSSGGCPDAIGGPTDAEVEAGVPDGGGSDETGDAPYGELPVAPGPPVTIATCRS